MTQSRLTFTVAGTQLVGNLFSPPGDAQPVARAILTGPLTSVKEQSAGIYAAALADRGYETLAFDHRTFGESGGEPRQFENPFAKIEDIRAAVTALEERGRDDLPMFAVGVCMGGGYMARAAVEDDRFDGFAGIAGVYVEKAPGAETSASVLRGQAAEKKYRETGVADSIPAVGPDGGDIAMPLREAYEYYGTPRGAVPNYTNDFAVQSFAYTGTFDALGAAPLIKVPAIVIHSEKAMIPELAHRFVAGLKAPHEEHWLQSQGQIDFYDDPRLIDPACDAIVSFFAKTVEPVVTALPNPSASF